MKAELKAAWIAALRSGSYTQAQGTLQSLNGFCCLGVLCDVAETTAGIVTSRNVEKQLLLLGSTLSSQYGMRDIQAELRGISVQLDGGVLTEHEPLEQHLMRMNDEQNKSFAEIADYIEAHLPVTP